MLCVAPHLNGPSYSQYIVSLFTLILFWSRLAWRRIFTAYNAYLFHDYPHTTFRSRFVHKLAIIGDDFAYGFGDLAGLGFSPGLGRHLCKQLRNEKRLKHCWQIYNKGVSRSLSSDWVPSSEKPRPDSKNYFEQWFLKSRAHDAEVVIIILGFSDVRARYFGRNPISAEETVQNIVGLARVLRNLGKDVWVCPVSCWGDEKAVVEDSLVEENKRRNEILELYLEGNKDGVQAGPWIDGRKFDFKHDGFYYFDGVHFNTKGYEKLAKDFVDILLTSLIKREFNMMKDLLT